MSTGIYKVAFNGPSDIVWTKLGTEAIGNTLQVAGNASAVLAAGLSLVAVAQNQQIIQKVKQLDAGIKNIQARFDLLFLDRSIDYFLELHINRIGLNNSALQALSEDCDNALIQIVDNKDLRLPGFLRHRIQSLSQSIFLFNQMHYSVIHNGETNWLEPRSIEKWVAQIESLQGANPDGGICNQDIIAELWSVESNSRLSKQSKGIPNPFNKRITPIVDRACLIENFARSREILVLSREIELAIRYIQLLSDKLSGQNQSLLLTGS